MKKILLVVVVQGLDIFVISVCFVYFCGGIFFRALAPIFGLTVGGVCLFICYAIYKKILSLAVKFHPHDVAFLLIDYKGRRS